MLQYCSYLVVSHKNMLNINIIARGVTTGGKGNAIPRAPNRFGGAEKSQQCHKYTLFNTVHLVPKDLRFEHVDAKFASCPGRHLTSLLP